MEEATYTRQLEEQAASAGEGSLASVARVSVLLDRCRLRLVKRDFEGAREVRVEPGKGLGCIHVESSLLSFPVRLFVFKSRPRRIVQIVARRVWGPIESWVKNPIRGLFYDALSRQSR